MNKNNHAPRLRFPDFTDDWEQRKFSDIALRESSVQTASSNQPSVEYEDVVSEEGRLNKDVNLKETNKKGIAFDGTQVLYGKLRPYLHNWLNPDFTGVAVGDWWVLQPVGLDKNFLYRLIQTQQFDEVANLSSGSKMPRADWKLVSNTEFAIPSSINEQRQIANTFDSLDNLITLHQRKLDAIKEYKQGMLQKMFPKEGESVPEVRFPGFTDPWEQRKVGEVITEVSRPIEMRDDQLYQLVTVKRRNEGIVSRGFYYGKDILVKNYYEIHKGDYLISKRQLVHGANGQVPAELDNSIVSNEYMVCIGNETLSAEFLALLSKTERVKRDFFLSSYGVDIEKFVFNVNDWKKRSLVLPILAEQNTICDFFRNLDNLITLHQRKVDQMKEYKKGLLQQMFV